MERRVIRLGRSFLLLAVALSAAPAAASFVTFESGQVRPLEAYTLLDGRYAPIPEREGRIASIVVPGWYVRPAWLWGEPRTSVLDALAELIRG